MAEVSITSLEEATSADGAIIIPVVQGGTTKRITLSNLLFTDSIGKDQIADNSVGAEEANASLTSSLASTVQASITPSSIGASTAAATVTAQSAADTANALAATKVKTFSQPSTPTATAVGDLWVNTETTQLFRATAATASNWVGQDIIAANSITSDKFAGNSITARVIAANSITSNQLSATTVNAIQVSAANIDTNSITADVINSIVVNTSQIAANAVTADQILANTITAAQIDGGTITATEIAANSITANAITANTIATFSLSANQITTGTLSANRIGTITLDACSITATQIAANAVTAHQVAAGGVTAIHIANNSISTGSVISNAITSESITSNNLSINGTLNGDFDGQITGPDGSGTYTFNLGTKGFIFHAPSGTAVINTLVARNNIVTGNMISYDESLGGLTTDTNGKIKIDVDDETLKIAGGKLEIGTVPSNAVANAYQDINWQGFSAGIENQGMRTDAGNGTRGGVMYFAQSDNTHLTITRTDTQTGTVEGFEIGDICVLTKNTSGSNYDPLNLVVKIMHLFFFDESADSSNPGYVPAGVRVYWAPAEPIDVRRAMANGTITTSSNHSINFNQALYGPTSIVTDTDGTYGIINTKTVSGSHPELYNYQAEDTAAIGNRATNNPRTPLIPNLISKYDNDDHTFLLGKIDSDDYTDAATNIKGLTLYSLPIEIDLVGRCKIKVADKTGFVIGESISGSSSLASGTITDTFTITETHSTGTVTTDFIEYEQVGATVFTTADTVTGGTSSSSTTIDNTTNLGFTGGIIGKDGLTHIARFGSQTQGGETKLSIILGALWSSTNNLTAKDLAGRSSLRNRHATDVGYGTVNPLLPNTKFTYTLNNWTIQGPDNDTQKYLYLWLGTQTGNLSTGTTILDSNKVFETDKMIRFGLKSTNDSWIAMATTGTLTNTSNTWASFLDPNNEYRNHDGS
jgi:hypothetical protein